MINLKTSFHSICNSVTWSTTKLPSEASRISGVACAAISSSVSLFVRWVQDGISALINRLSYSTRKVESNQVATAAIVSANNNETHPQATASVSSDNNEAQLRIHPHSDAGWSY